MQPRAYDAEDRPLWYDWVFNRQLTLKNYYSARELVLTLVDIVSRGGSHWNWRRCVGIMGHVSCKSTVYEVKWETLG
jgi:hypothetical protein